MGEERGLGEQLSQLRVAGGQGDILTLLWLSSSFLPGLEAGPQREEEEQGGVATEWGRLLHVFHFAL